MGVTACKGGDAVDRCAPRVEAQLSLTMPPELEFGDAFEMVIEGAAPLTEVEAWWSVAGPGCQCPYPVPQGAPCLDLQQAELLGAGFADEQGRALLEVAIGNDAPVGTRWIQVVQPDGGLSAVSNVVEGTVSDWLSGRQPPGGAHYIVRAPEAGDLFGTALSSTALTSPTGRPQLAVGAPLSGDGTGAVYLFEPSCCSVHAVTAPAADSPQIEQLTTWRGRPGDAAGTSVVVDDIDGDGQQDLVVGAPGLSNDPGRVYVVHGPFEDGGELAEVADLQLVGANRSGVGLGVVWLGDDLAVLGKGGVWLVDAAARGQRSLQDAREVGTLPSTLPWSVDAGDIDGDGVRDLLVGVPDGQGQVAVVPGPVARWSLNLKPAPAKPQHERGRAVAFIGDVDGDGREDVAVGAPGADDQQGRVYVYVDRELRDVWLDVGGVPDGVGFGSKLARVGDIDGDGRAELIVSTPEASPDGREKLGLVHLFYEPRPGNLMAEDADFTIQGQDPGDRAGAGLAGGGDLDDDGYADFVLGHGYGWDAREAPTGVSGVYVFRGAPGWDPP